MLRKSSCAALLLAALALAACDRQPSTASGQPSPNRPSASSDSAPRTTDPSKVTPGDQSESETDRRITAEVRRLVLAANLSVSAQNCTIVTRSGVVTLRGRVDSEAEKTTIRDRAQGVPGVTSVVNELEVTPK